MSTTALTAIDVTSQSSVDSFFDYSQSTHCQHPAHILHAVSRYHTIDIIEHSQFGRILFLNRGYQSAEKNDNHFSLAITTPLRKKSASGHLENVLILGGGSGGVLRAVLDLKPKKVCVIDIDKEVIEASRLYFGALHKNAFSEPSVEIIIHDANIFLSSVESNSIDAIIYDLSDLSFIVTDSDRELYLDTLFSHTQRCLKVGGVVSVHCCSPSNHTVIHIFRTILSKYYPHVFLHKVFIPLFGTQWVFASAHKETLRSNIFSIQSMYNNVRTYINMLSFSPVWSAIVRPLELLYKISFVLKQHSTVYATVVRLIKGV